MRILLRTAYFYPLPPDCSAFNNHNVSSTGIYSISNGEIKCTDPDGVNELKANIKKELQNKEEEVNLLKATQAKLHVKINELELGNCNKKESLEAQLKTMKELASMD